MYTSDRTLRISRIWATGSGRWKFWPESPLDSDVKFCCYPCGQAIADFTIPVAVIDAATDEELLQLIEVARIQAAIAGPSDVH